MLLDELQRQTLKDWMRSKAIIRCPVCGEDRWRFATASYVAALLEEHDQNLTEDRGVVKISCDNCGYVMLCDTQIIGIGRSWDRSRNL